MARSRFIKVAVPRAVRIASGIAHYGPAMISVPGKEEANKSAFFWPGSWLSRYASAQKRTSSKPKVLEVLG